MKQALAILLAVAFTFASAAEASKQTFNFDYGSSRQHASNLQSHRHFRNKVGRDLRSRPASAQCQDGSQSFSRHHRGTCSGHGGVAR